MNETLAGERTIAKSMTLEILTSSVKLPPIPTNGTKLLEMVQSPMDNIEISDFAKLVEIDPGLITSVLKLANSSYYGGIEEIVSLRAAITRIGLTEAIHSVCLYLFKGILPKLPAIEGYSSKEYWDFSWSCAQANRRLGHPNLGMDVIPGHLYLAGLLQSIGKIMLAIHYPDDFSKCLKTARQFKAPLAKVEKDIFGTSDCFIAANILDSWSLPKSVCEAVAYSHAPEQAPPEFRLNAALTQLAYAVAQKTGIGASGDGLELDIDSTYICRLKNTQLAKPDLRAALVDEITEDLMNKHGSISDSPKAPSKKSRKAAPPVTNRKKPTGNRTAKKGLFKTIKGWFS